MFIAFPPDADLQLDQGRSSYHSWFTREEQDEILATSPADIFDGVTLRLEQLSVDSEVKMVYSRSSFFQLMTSNLLMEGDADSFAVPLADRVRQFQQEVRQAADGRGQALDCPYLDNSLGVSVLIHNGRDILCSQRSGRVAISPHQISMAVVGGLDDQDIGGLPNPILHGAAREVREELGYDLDLNHVRLRGIHFHESTYKPSVLLDLKVDEDLAELVSDPGPDFSLENDAPLIVPIEKADRLFDQSMTATARFHLHSFLEE